MEKNNILLPFAFNQSSFNESNALDTTPRDKFVIDENASSTYHTRKTGSQSPIKPKLSFKPSLKRKMGESFNDKDDVKRTDIGEDVEEDDYEDKAHEGSTMIDDFNEDNDFIFVPPSSPPIDSLAHANPLASEFDFPTNTIFSHQTPRSPSKSHIQELKSSPQRNLSSEPDFGIDKFNRYKGSSFNDRLKSTQQTTISFNGADFLDCENIKKTSYNEARQIILDSFENINTVINLESMNLHEIPTEIKDLNNLVVFCDSDDDLKYQLYLTNNRLKFLPPALFKFSKLQVLGLRQNEIDFIPASVSNLVNLIDLSVSLNKLKFLPYQILGLKKLQNFVAGPNPYLKPVNDVIQISKKLGDNFLNYRSEVKYFSNSNTYLPSLKSLCLNRIANHDVTYSETKTWKKYTPKIYHNLIIEAITKGKYQDTCNQCNLIVVEPVAEVMEWWDILKNKNIPIRKQFCSKSCVNSYLRSIDHN